MRASGVWNGMTSGDCRLPAGTGLLTACAALFCMFFISGCAGAPRPGDAPAAAAKVSPSLTAAGARLESGVNPASFARGAVRADSAGRLQVYVYVDQLTPAVLAGLAAHGLVQAVPSPELHLVQGWVNPHNLLALADLPFVIRITPPRYALPR